jgi:hypothetical protein
MTTPEINKIKEELWNQQLSKLKSEDININDFNEKDVVDSVYTVDFRIAPELMVDKIGGFIERLKVIQPDLHYYNLEKLHITVLGHIKKDLPIENYLDKVKQVLANEEYLFDVVGINSNNQNASITFYPRFSFSQLRNNLRKVFGEIGGDYTKHLSIYEEIGWSNFLKYPVVPKIELLDALRKEKDTVWGVCKPEMCQVLRVRSRRYEDGG